VVGPLRVWRLRYERAAIRSVLVGRNTKVGMDETAMGVAMQARHKIVAALAIDIAIGIEGVNQGQGRQTREAMACHC
jgi:hypothetical protein